MVVPELHLARHVERQGEPVVGVGLGARQHGVALQHAGLHLHGVAAELQADVHPAREGRKVHLGPGPQILHVRIGPGQQGHAAEDAEEAEEVLILQVRGGGALVHLHAQGVARLADGVSQVELGRGERVLRIAQEHAVEPDVHRLLHALKAHAHALAAQRLVQVEFAHIGADRVVVRLGELALHALARHAGERRAAVLVALPRIQGVDVVNLVIAGHLDVARHRDVIEGRDVVAFLIEVCRTGFGVHGVCELPHAVEGLPQRLPVRPGVRLGCIVEMIAVRIDQADAEHARVVEPPDIGLHARVPPRSVQIA